MLYFSEVESSLKQGCSVQLGPRTVICGANKSGKTTIIQALELAANGWVGDMEGRSRVKQQQALARLFPADVPMYARAKLSDGTAFSWAMEKGSKAGTFKKPSHDPPRHVRWPVQELNEVLTGSTLSSWLEARVSGEVTDEDIIGAVPPAVRGAVEILTKKYPDADFLRLAKAARDEARRLRMAATKQENTVKQMTQGIAPPLLKSKREKLKTELAGLQVAPSSGISLAEHAERREDLNGLIEAFVATQGELDRVAPTSPQLAAALVKVNTGLNLIVEHTKTFSKDGHDPVKCFVCSNTEPDFAGQVAWLQDCLKQLGPAQEAASRRQLVVQKLVRAERDMKRGAEQFKRLKVAEAPDPAIAQRRNELLGLIARDDAAGQTWKNSEAANIEIAQARAKADHLTTAAKALESVGKALLESNKAEFETAVGVYLPGGEKLGVDLGASRLGLVREGQVHSALSGAEWNLVLLALASAQEDGKALCVLAPEDKGWDAKTLASVMEALVYAPVQIIVMATVTPEPVEGWTCINL